MASLVIRVITLYDIVILSLFNHLYFVNAFLSIITRPSSSYRCKIDGNFILTLAGKTPIKRLGLLMSSMMSW